METLDKKSLFWDTKKPDPKKNGKFIIARILDFGDVEDFQWAMEYYGREKIMENIKTEKSLGQKSRSFWRQYFKIGNSECTWKQSTPPQSAFWKRLPKAE
ncbi:MAG: hypothetical protein HY336_02035 [Candidatus Doudnabacteria bacterium]|nr:hypothetical protein [Candidatus Doudnabacteria bacterium]